jgi:hypothetical protein
MLAEKSAEAFDAFYEAASHNDVLDPKTTLLIQFATAMSAACYP